MGLNFSNMSKSANISKKFKALTEKITYRQWLLISAVISLTLGVLVFLSLNGQLSEQDTQPANLTAVVVAKRDIEPKTIITAEMLERREVPAHLLPTDAITDIMDVVNKPAKVAIMKDDVVSSRKVLTNITMAGFTGSIPPDCRAVSIAITDVTGVSGFAQPGDRVDVMLIANNDSKMVGRIILQDVQLLAINKTSEQQNVPDNKAAAKGDTKKTGAQDSAAGKESADKQEASQPAAKVTDKPATATLALLPADMLKLITEAQEGTLYLALRPYKPQNRYTPDTKHIHYSNVQTVKPSSTVSKPEVRQSAAPAPVQTAPAAPARQSVPVNTGSVVEVIRGTAITMEGR